MHIVQQRMIYLSEDAFDVLVVGGGFGGVAAAYAAAQTGATTCLVESRTYLGQDLMSTLRPWLSYRQVRTLTELFNWDDEWAKPTRVSNSQASDEFALVPLKVKLNLENSLLQVGVKLKYGARLTGWRHTSDGFSIEISGKFGRREIRTRTLIDATPNGNLLGCTPSSYSLRETYPHQYRRTLEFTHVDTNLLADTKRLQFDAKELQSHGIDISGSNDQSFEINLHPGYHDEGHLLIEFPCSPKETEATLSAMDLAKWLNQHHPAFAEARVASSTYETFSPAPRRSVSLKLNNSSTIPIKLGTQGEPVVDTDAGRFPLIAFLNRHNLWIASANADIDDESAVKLHGDPASLAQTGQAIGRAASQVGVLPSTFNTSINRLPTVQRKVDVLVVGGGTSGAAAAISAAREGKKTLLIEMNPGLGGTGTFGGVDSYWYGRKGGFNAEVAEKVKEESGWMRPNDRKWSIPGKMTAWLRMATDAGVEIAFHTVAVDVYLEESNDDRSSNPRLKGVLAAGPEQLLDIEAPVIIDATGDGDLAVLAGAEYTYGSDRESLTMWYSMAPYSRPGITRNNFTSSVNVGDLDDYTRAILSARRRGGDHDHVIYVAPRESRHILSDVRLTLTDQLTMRKWPDVVNITFSNHDIKGHSSSDWLRMGLIPPNLEVEIPYRCLIPKGVDGLLVTGKAISATHNGLPAIRMQADLENLGYACGIAASMCVDEEVPPRSLSVKRLQRKLVSSGLLPSEILDRKHEDTAHPLSREEMKAWINSLDDRMKLYDYSDMGFEEVRREPIPIVQVCTAGPSIVPLLMEALHQPEHAGRRLSLARALAWYGNHEAVPVLMEAIEEELSQPGLPKRVARIRHANPSPDQGAMPDLAYLLHTLAMVRDERSIPLVGQVVRRMDPRMEVFKDRTSGLFHYVDAVCDIAERLGHPDCLEHLFLLHGYPLFHGHVSLSGVQPDFFLERLAYLEIVIGRAIARCGDKKGVEILVDYLQDNRSLLARCAHQELIAITGLVFDADYGRWKAWLQGIDRISPKPWVSSPDHDRPFLSAGG